MVNLDNLKLYKRFDPADMLAHLHGLPKQCREAWLKAKEFALPANYADIDKVVISGMGGSAIGGDLLRNLTSSIAKPIIFVQRDYTLPAFIDDKTLIIASSYSGMTEETISAFSQALSTNSKKLVITTGGKLKTLAEGKAIPVFTIDYVGPPRASLGYSFMPLLAFLQKLGFIENKSAEVEEMLQVLETLLSKVSEDVPTQLNPAKQLANKLFGKVVIIYGAGILSAAAHRWKTQINENSKAWAFSETFPELNHNAVVGYEFPKHVAKQACVILLHSPSLHPKILLRYQITSEILEKAGIEHETIDSQGKNELSQIMSLVFLGDWVSYYLAILYEADPSPVKAIDYLKKRLSDARP